jgi:hypothetical protein
MEVRLSGPIQANSSFSSVQLSSSQVSISKTESSANQQQSVQYSISAESAQMASYSFDDYEEYFSSHDMSKLKEQYSELTEINSADDAKELILRKLFNLEDDSRTRRLRDMAHKIDQQERLEEILFEKKSQKKVSFSISAEIEISSEQSNASVEGDGKLWVDVSAGFSGRASRQESDPLILDLNGDGINTTGIKNGVNFDIDGDGDKEQTSFVDGDDMALALDKNGNGIIDGGQELFGDASGYSDGIEELRAYDDNHDGVINKEDSVFDSLKLFNASNQAASLSSFGVTEINLNRLSGSGFSSMGDRYDGELGFTMADGSQRKARDYWFQHL